MNCCHVVSGYYPFLPAPFEYTQKLADAGVSVDVVARRRAGEPTNQMMGRVHVSRVTNADDRRRSSRNVISFVQPVLRAMHGKHYDLVHVYAFRGCCLLPILGKHISSNWIIDLRTGNVSPNRRTQALANNLTAIESDAFSARISLDRLVGERVFGSRRDFNVVPLGADIGKFASGNRNEIRSRYGWSDEEQIVIYMGSMAPQRNPHIIMQAFAHALELRDDLKLLILYKASHFEVLQSALVELGIEDKVHLLHDIPYAQIESYVCAADIGFAYVPASQQFYYQPPLKTVEFLAAGLPTVATDTYGNRQFIRHRENGILAADDPVELQGYRAPGLRSGNAQSDT